MKHATSPTPTDLEISREPEAGRFGYREFCGTRAELIAAGVASPEMFPLPPRRSKSRRWAGMAAVEYWTCDALPDGCYRIRRELDFDDPGSFRRQAEAYQLEMCRLAQTWQRWEIEHDKRRVDSPALRRALARRYPGIEITDASTLLADGVVVRQHIALRAPLRTLIADGAVTAEMLEYCRGARRWRPPAPIDPHAVWLLRLPRDPDSASDRSELSLVTEAAPNPGADLTKIGTAATRRIVARMLIGLTRGTTS